MVYLWIIIVAAVAGIVRLWLQHRREQRIDLVEDFRAGLERLSSQPLPQGDVEKPATRLGWSLKAPRLTRGERPAPAATGSASVMQPQTAAVNEPIPQAGRSQPLLDRVAGKRLWRKPREPWFWTYEKRPPRRPPARANIYLEEEFGLSAVSPDWGFATDADLSTDPRVGREAVAARRAGHTPLDPARRDAARRRIEMRHRSARPRV